MVRQIFSTIAFKIGNVYKKFGRYGWPTKIVMEMIINELDQIMLVQVSHEWEKLPSNCVSRSFSCFISVGLEVSHVSL